MAAILGNGDRNRRLDIRALVRVKNETSPGNVYPVAEGAAGKRVSRNPFLIVQCGWRSGLVNEYRGAPSQIATAVKGSLVDGDSIGRRGAIKTQAGVIYIAT